MIRFLLRWAFRYDPPELLEEPPTPDFLSDEAWNYHQSDQFGR